MAFSLNDFERAVLLVTNPPPGAVAGGPEAGLLAQATSYIQQLAAHPEAYRLCVQLLLETAQPAARFFSLQAIAQFVASPGYASLDAGRSTELRGALLHWAGTSMTNGTLASQPTYVRTKLAVVFGTMIRRDYPSRWPSAFHDVLGPLMGGLQALQAAVARGEPCPPPTDPALRCACAGVDLFLRVTSVVQEDVAEARIHRPSPAERAQAGLVKDAMRTGWSPTPAAVAEAAAGGFPPPSPASPIVPWMVECWHGIVTTLAVIRPGLAARALSAMASYADWIDVTLLANERFLGLFYGLLTRRLPPGAALPPALGGSLASGALPRTCFTPLRGSVLLVLASLIDKGMETGAKMGLVQACRLPEVLASLCGDPRSLLPDAPEEEGDEGEGQQGQQGSSVREVIASYGGGGDEVEEDQPWGVAVTELLCFTGRALLAAGETGSVLASAVGNPGALEWLGGSIRGTLGLALAVTELSGDPACVGPSSTLFLEVVPLLTDVVAAFHREAKASPPPVPSEGGGGMGSRTPSSVALAGLAAAATGAALGGAGGKPRRSLGGTTADGVPGSPSLGGQHGPACVPLPRGFEGRPGGVSLSEPGLLPRLLEALPSRLSFPPSHVFGSAAAASASASSALDPDGDGGGCDDEEEEGVLLARDAARKLWVNIARAAPEAAAAWLGSSAAAACPANVGALRQLLAGAPSAALVPTSPNAPGRPPAGGNGGGSGSELMSWQRGEALLSLIYHFGEGAAAFSTSALRSGSGPLFEVVSGVLSAQLSPAAHPALLLLAHELAARYHVVLPAQTQTQGPAGSPPAASPAGSSSGGGGGGASASDSPLLARVLSSMVGPCGLLHPSPAVRSRVSYLLLKTVRSLVRSDTPRDAASLAPFVDALLNGVAPFLSVPAIPAEVIEQIRAAAAAGTSAGGSGSSGRPGGGGGASGGGGGPLAPPGSAPGGKAPGSLSSRRERSSSLSGPISSDLLATRGAAGLGPEDQQFLFETVGLLLGPPPSSATAAAASSSSSSGGPAHVSSLLGMTVSRRMRYIEALLGPMGEGLAAGLAQLSAIAGAGGASGSPNAAAVASTGNVSNGVGGGLAGGVVAPLPSSSTDRWPPELLAEVAAWIVRSLNALGHMTKGFGALAPPLTPQAQAALDPATAAAAVEAAASTDRLASLLERCLGLAMRAVGVLPAHPHVRGKAVFLLHRLVDCLDARLLPLLPPCLPLLLAGPTPDDLVSVLVLLNQAASRFKGAAGPLLREALLHVVSRVYDLMPPQGKGGGGGVTPGGASDASAAAAAAGGTSTGSGGDDSSRARVELTRAYFAFLSHIACTPGLATPVLAPGGGHPNEGRLFDIVLGGLAEGIAAAPDAGLAKTGLATLTALTKAWLPVKAQAQAPAPGPGAGAMSAPPALGASSSSGMNVSPPKKGGVTPFPPKGGALGGGAAAPTGSGGLGKLEPLPSPLPKPLRGTFIRWLVSTAVRASWTAALSPGCAEVAPIHSGAPGSGVPAPTALGLLSASAPTAAGPAGASGGINSVWEGNAGASAAFVEAIGLQATAAVHVAVATGAPLPSSAAALAGGGGGGGSDVVSHMLSTVLPGLAADLVAAAGASRPGWSPARQAELLSGPHAQAAFAAWTAYCDRLRGCLAPASHKDARPQYVAAVKALRALVQLAAQSG